MRGQAPVLTRGAAGADGKLVIYQDATRSTLVVTWPAGARMLAWPSNLPFADGELFSLNLDDTGATQVRWRTIHTESQNLTSLAESLLDNGCYDQLDTLQSQVADR
jgi:hypothetical protein